MAAVGASPTYYTFDTFDEVSFTTGGNDVRVPTGGMGISLVTKRGTNSFHGSAGINFAHDDIILDAIRTDEDDASMNRRTPASLAALTNGRKHR